MISVKRARQTFEIKVRDLYFFGTDDKTSTVISVDEI